MGAFNSQYSLGVSYTAVPITPSDSADIANGPIRWLDVLTGGNIAFVDGRGNDVTLSNVPSGYSVKCVVKRIKSTGTTASGFIGYP